MEFIMELLMLWIAFQVVVYFLTFAAAVYIICAVFQRMNKYFKS